MYNSKQEVNNIKEEILESMKKLEENILKAINNSNIQSSKVETAKGKMGILLDDIYQNLEKIK